MTAGQQVLMITGDYPPAVTGVGDYARRLVESLTVLGLSVDVFTGASDGGAAAPRDWRIDVIRRVLAEVDRRGSAPLVHIQYPALAYGRTPAINLLPAVLKLLRPGCRVVVTMHEFRSMRRRWRARVVPMLCSVDAVVLPDELDRPLVARWCRARTRVASIPLGPNIDPVPMTPAERAAWRVELGLPGPEPIAVFFGGVYEHKGVRELIAAVRSLRSRGVTLRLLMVGAPDPGGRFKGEVERLIGAGQGERWARWLPDAAPEVVSRCLEASELAVFPFHSGAMSNRASLLVALGHGLPAVTTRTAATPASFGAATGMALVPPHDAAALAACMGELIGSPERRGMLAAAALDYARAFSWDVVARQTAELYYSLARRRVPGATEAAAVR